MLPDADDFPARLAETFVGVLVPGDVPRELLCPPSTVPLWHRPVEGTHVPEAPVDEDGDLNASEDHVRAPARQSRQWVVHAEAQAPPMEFST